MSAPGGAGRWLAIAATLVVVAAVAMAVATMGTPSMQREGRFDKRRVADLDRIDTAVREYAKSRGALPRDLATLAAQPGRRLPIVDPKDGTPYTYRTNGPREFRLCAVFVTDTARTPEGGESMGGQDWSHPVGRYCFERRLRSDSESK